MLVAPTVLDLPFQGFALLVQIHTGNHHGMIHGTLPVVQAFSFFHIKMDAVCTLKVIAVCAPKSHITLPVFSNIASKPHDLTIRKLADNQFF